MSRPSLSLVPLLLVAGSVGLAGTVQWNEAAPVVVDDVFEAGKAGGWSRVTSTPAEAANPASRALASTSRTAPSKTPMAASVPSQRATGEASRRYAAPAWEKLARDGELDVTAASRDTELAGLQSDVRRLGDIASAHEGSAAEAAVHDVRRVLAETGRLCSLGQASDEQVDAVRAAVSRLRARIERL